jgi:subtilisin family serine protease
MLSFSPRRETNQGGSFPEKTGSSASLLTLVHLGQLMDRVSGSADVKVGLIDGPVATHHPDLATSGIQELRGKLPASCTLAASSACVHGTFVAGVLAAKRGGAAPAIAPACTLLVRPIFAEDHTQNSGMPSATPEELATAIVDTVDAGARVLNLSAALLPGSPRGELRLSEALVSGY